MSSRWLVSLVFCLVLAGCSHVVIGAVDDGSVIDSPCSTGQCVDRPRDVDLLAVVDNSNTMRENQTNFMMQIGIMLARLTDPPCVSSSNPTPHTCNPSGAGETLQYPRVESLHVGVVSTDLGTPGSSVPGCRNSGLTDTGDDARLNPIRFGGAIASHEPWATAPPTFGRPSDCADPNEFPSFITYESRTDDVEPFVHDFQCNAGLYLNGCGLQSQLDAVYRALVLHDARDTPGNTSPNAGFVRENALLSIVVLSDEDDGSVRDCRFANGTACTDGATDVYRLASTAWSAADLNSRFYLYQPCSAQDPTWPLERYVDPSNPNAGLFALKPGHPERILFAAITGVPLAIPMNGDQINWDGLLGAVPAGRSRDDFCARDSSTLGNMTSAEGPVSMMQANHDPNCSQRVVPACYREGSAVNPTACTQDIQYFAWPARRIVEVARRFDESPLCNGHPCRHGLVTSICSSNYAAVMETIIRAIRDGI